MNQSRENTSQCADVTDVLADLELETTVYLMHLAAAVERIIEASPFAASPPVPRSEAVASPVELSRTTP